MTNKYRKLPKQTRSKATVDILLVATTRLLLEQGVDNLTTNRVAERAGVSIGSLYQYFPNKASLIAALIDQHVENEIERLTILLSSWQGPVDETLIRAVITEFIQIHLDDIELTKLLHEQVSHLECRYALRQATKYFEGMIAELLKAGSEQLSDKVIRIRSFIVTNAIDALIQLALAENVTLLSDPTFVDELVDIVIPSFQPRN